MQALMVKLDNESKIPMYMQLYEEIKGQILDGQLGPDEKLPSLRNLSDFLKISITTVEQAYAQLLVEGYVYSSPHRGYFVSNISPVQKDQEQGFVSLGEFDSSRLTDDKIEYDVNCFDFTKWKKYTNKVFNLYPHLLMSPSDPQGEEFLRHEISKYIYTARGVKCVPEQIVIAAGTQQITGHIARILHILGIRNIALEEPCYLPVNNIFRDRGFAISRIPVKKDGICIERLPSNIQSAVYVNPSNQFPTGAVMPVGKRYKLLEWAKENDSYIIEDDYNSELRYFGKPVVSLKGMDTLDRVIYLGSFSATLFPSVKISYMVLPKKMAEIFKGIRKDYSQTCSKTEQLALAFYMADGKFQTGIKKIRKLYSQKLSMTINAFSKFGRDMVKPINMDSGINVIIKVKSKKTVENLSRQAKEVGLLITSTEEYSNPPNWQNDPDEKMMIFYYTRVPIEKIELLVEKLIDIWKKEDTSER